MSNWLGFSLTPHLRIDEGFGRETQDHGGFAPHLSVMPLRSDGSLCAADPFRRSDGADGIACDLQLHRKLSKHNILLLFLALHVVKDCFLSRSLSPSIFSDS